MVKFLNNQEQQKNKKKISDIEIQTLLGDSVLGDFFSFLGVQLLSFLVSKYRNTSGLE